MSGTDGEARVNADAARENAPARPELLAPQLLMRPAPAAAFATISVALGLASAFMLFGDYLGSGTPGADGSKNAGDRDKVFSVAPDQTTGAFKILPTSFQNTPGSVLAQLNMPEAEKQRLAEKLADA